MSERPTKNDVEQWKDIVQNFQGTEPTNLERFFVLLADAYLALEAHHTSNVKMWQGIVDKLQKTCEEADTEIAALKAEKEDSDKEYLRMKAFYGRTIDGLTERNKQTET